LRFFGVYHAKCGSSVSVGRFAAVLRRVFNTPRFYTAASATGLWLLMLILEILIIFFSCGFLFWFLFCFGMGLSCCRACVRCVAECGALATAAA